MSSNSKKEVFLQVDGMHCSNCEQFIEQKARNAKGIQMAEASYATDMLRVEYDPQLTNLGSLADIFSNTGYVVKEREQNTEIREEENNEIARLLIGGLFSYTPPISGIPVLCSWLPVKDILCF